MGIAKYLKRGRISINVLEKQIEISDKDVIIPYDTLTDSDWGLVYEKFVGQTLEDEGYTVIYRGLEKGLFDRGIDLIAQKDTELNFIQCKYIKNVLSKSKIEWILYKASGILYETYKKEARKLSFTLVVNNKDVCFSKKAPKSMRMNTAEISKVEYPMLHYFLSHNSTQDKVKVKFREIEMLK